MPADSINTLQEFVQSFGSFKNNTAIIAVDRHGKTAFSYAELRDKAHELAVGLKKGGIAVGDRVGIAASNRPEWIIAALGIMRSGATVVPLDSEMSQESLEHIMKDSGVKLLFTDQKTVKRLKLPPKLTRLLLDRDEGDNSWTSLLDSEGMESEDVELEDAWQDQSGALFYTSGTTGPPKGVPLTHSNLMAALNGLNDVKLAKPADRFLLPLPLYHVYPFVVGMIYPLSLGRPLILPMGLTGPLLARVIREEKVSVMFGVPHLFSAFYSSIKRQAEEAGTAGQLELAETISSWTRKWLGLGIGRVLLAPLHKRIGKNLRLLATGGALIEAELAVKLQSLGWDIAIGYGLTETAGLLTINPPGGDLNFVGKPLTNVEVRIKKNVLEKDPARGRVESPAAKSGPARGHVDPPAAKSGRATGKDSRHEIDGEIQVRGPNVFDGYWKLKNKTKDSFTEDGWFRTGDLGYQHGANLHVAGRESTLIVTASGKKFQPEDVERVYASHAIIEEIGIFQQGDKSLAAVILPDMSALRNGEEADLTKAVRQAVEQQTRTLPHHQRIAEYAISRDPLPKTRLGKIRRHLLEDAFSSAKEEPSRKKDGHPISIDQMSDGDQRLLEDDSALQVWQWLSRRYKGVTLTPGTSPRLDLGVDSMEWLSLSLEIAQNTGVELDDEAINRIETVRDLLQEVANASEKNAHEDSAQPLEQPERFLSDEQKKWLKLLGPVEAFCARLFYHLNRAVMRLFFKLKIEGLDNLPAKGEQVIFAPNHGSYLDPMALAAALEFDRLRNTQWATASPVFSFNPFIRLACRLAQAVPVEPDRAIMSSLAMGSAVLKRGRNLVWFPEQRRTVTGELQDFKPGVGLLLDRFDLPVVPIFIGGAHEALPPGRFWPRAGTITVRFGQPATPRKLKRMGKGRQKHRKLVNALMEEVRKLGAAA